MQYAVLALVLVSAWGAVDSGADVSAKPAARLQVDGAIASDKGKRVSDAEIRRRMIEESIDSYPGNCPCPYNRASNGSQCGRRSAYSREGGYAPLCYPSDISDAMVREYRAAAGID